MTQGTPPRTRNSLLSGKRISLLSLSYFPSLLLTSSEPFNFRSSTEKDNTLLTSTRFSSCIASIFTFMP